MVRMTDVAREAGVTAMTVSNVLNGRPGASDATRRRVLEAAARLGYQMNVTARQLRAGRAGAVGVFVSDFDLYYSHLAARLADLLEPHGLAVRLEKTGADRTRELALLTSGRLRAYDAVVMSPVHVDVADLQAARVDMPCVILGERSLVGPFERVRMDNEASAELATGALLDSGARRIALVGGRRDCYSADHMATLRTRGYLKAHIDRGLTADERLIWELPSFTPEDGRRAIEQLIAAGASFDAVFALTDSAAMGVLRGLADARLAVPGRVQVIGFDDDPEGQYLVPRLSTVDPGNDELVGLVVDSLLAQLGGTGREPRVQVTSPRLVLRESTRAV